MNDFVKICPKCGYHNPEGENICRHCSHFLGLVRPIPETDPEIETPEAAPDLPEIEEVELTPEEAPDMLVLESLTNGRTYMIESGSIVGRADETSQADVQLSDIPGINFISREHCRFFFQDGQWYATALRSAMNGLSVNQTQLGPGERILIEPGDTVVLANVPFRIRSGSPDRQDP